MEKIPTRLAATVSLAWLLVSFQTYSSTGAGGASIFGQGVVMSANLVVLVIYLSINLALPFSLSFTPFLGIALLLKIRTPPPDYRKAILTFVVSVIPFLISLVCFLGYLPTLLHRIHSH